MTPVQKFDLPWRVSEGWIRSASGCKVVELGEHYPTTVEEAQFIVESVNKRLEEKYGTTN